MKSIKHALWKMSVIGVIHNGRRRLLGQAVRDLASWGSWNGIGREE